MTGPGLGDCRRCGAEGLALAGGVCANCYLCDQLEDEQDERLVEQKALDALKELEWEERDKLDMQAEANEAAKLEPRT